MRLAVSPYSASRQNVDYQSFVGTFGFGSGFVDGVGAGQNHAHAAVAAHFRLAEDTDLDAGFGEHERRPEFLNVTIPLMPK